MSQSIHILTGRAAKLARIAIGWRRLAARQDNPGQAYEDRVTARRVMGEAFKAGGVR